MFCIVFAARVCGYWNIEFNCKMVFYTFHMEYVGWFLRASGRSIDSVRPLCAGCGLTWLTGGYRQPSEPNELAETG